MANIMLTYRCNMHCSYCFANKFVNKENTDISLKNFMQAVTFITRADNQVIGLIGGEPTLHPGFKLFMDLLNGNSRVKKVRVFTNGMLIDRYIPELTRKKVEVCVNCNSPDMIGEKAYACLQRNLDMLILEHNMKDRIQLGINLYSDEMDYSYIMDLLQRYGLHSVRTSLTVPDFSTCNETDALEHCRKRKDFLLEFYRKMDSIHVMPYSDCNRPPFCIWTEEEQQWLESYVARYPGIFTNLTSPDASCLPACDILPNLQAVRCFGMSDFQKVPISDFDSLYDLHNFFLKEIDAVAFKLPACEDCKSCHEWKVRHCFAGCIGYKADRLRACNEAIAQL